MHLLKRRASLAEHPLGWVVEPLAANPAFYERNMFGCRACYLGGRLVLVLAAGGRGPWNGLLLATEREHHASLIADHPDLSPHSVLAKWLYLPLQCEQFEQTATALVSLVLSGDPRIGVEPGARRRGRRASSKPVRRRTKPGRGRA